MKLGTFAVLAAAVGLSASGIAHAAPNSDEGLARHDRCYEETVRATAGTHPKHLSTVHCTRVLRAYSLSAEDKSAVLHNQGIVQQAKGQLNAAKDSFRRSVRLARRVDKRNLALAQVAMATGDFGLAIEQYDLLVATDVLKAETRAVILRNRDRALRAREERRVASTAVKN